MQCVLGDFHSPTHLTFHTLCVCYIHFTKPIISWWMHQISFHIYSVGLPLIYFSVSLVAKFVSQSLVIVVSVSSFQIWPFQTVWPRKQKLNWCSFSTVLAAPVLSVSSPSCDSIAVSWKAVYMAAGFSVSLMRSDGLGRMLKENTTNTSLIFTNLDPGTLYTIKAYAWNVDGIPGDDFTYNQRTSKIFFFLKLSKH